MVGQNSQWLMIIIMFSKSAGSWRSHDTNLDIFSKAAIIPATNRSYS